MSASPPPTSTDRVREIAAAVRGECTPDAPMAPRTSIRVGGPADLLVRPADPPDLATLLWNCAAGRVPVMVLGGGANLLVADAGIRGVVVRLPVDFGEESEDGERLVLSAGAPVSRLVQRAISAGLTGCEFASGIPGTLGGAAAMNAGTRIGEMKDVVERVEVATPEGLRWIPAAGLSYAYRSSRLPPGAVVTRVGFRLRRGDPAASRAVMDADREHRRRTQPLNWPTWGSTFRNPPGDHAGRLLELAGCKGLRCGGAEVSGRHANVIVNPGEATAADVRGLAAEMAARVRERFGVELRLELKILDRHGRIVADPAAALA